MDRRTFLTLGPVAAGAATLARAPDAAARPPRQAVVSSFDPWIEIHSANLRHNVAEISRLADGRPILAVIKNNGYGMGVLNAAQLLEPSRAIHGFAVVKLHEAVVLRDGGVRKPILLMGPVDEPGLAVALERDIMPMVYTPLGGVFDRIATRRQRPASMHVCVDTGIGRVGVPHREAAALIRDLTARSSVRVEGVMMTFAEDAAFDQEQKTRFTSLIDSLTADGINLGRRHACSSFGLFQHPDSFLDMVRPGMAIYGIYSEQEFRPSTALRLRPALALKTRVAYVKRLEAGESAGYGRAYRATAPVWIATLPVGHADGLPRAVANKARVRIGDGMYPIVASVSASHTIVEIGPARRVGIGDEVSVFDWQDGSRPEDLSAASGASVYDLTMHLNPLLPRRLL
jgi:alanine racemase